MDSLQKRIFPSITALISEEKSPFLSARKSTYYTLKDLREDILFSVEASSFLLYDVGFTSTFPESSKPIVLECESRICSLEATIRKSFKEFLESNGAETSFLRFLENGDFLKLSFKKREKIFDEIFTKGRHHHHLLIALMEIELSSVQWQNLFLCAFEKNDFELVKAIACKCPHNLESILKSLFDESSMVSLEFLRDRFVDTEIAQYLCLQLGISYEDIKDYEMRKFLANLWGVEQGTFVFDGQEVGYCGAFTHHFEESIQKSIVCFSEIFPEIIDAIEARKIGDLIDEAKESVCFQKKFEWYKQGHSILIHAGLIDHQLEVLMWRGRQDDLLILCNKGAISEVPIKIYKIDPNCVTKELIKEICNTKYLIMNDKEGELFFYQTLPKILRGKSSEGIALELTEKILASWQEEKVQNKSNCVWESLKTAFGAFLALEAWDQCKKGYMAISRALKKVIDWEKYFLWWGIHAYLDHAEKIGQVDHNLLTAVFDLAEQSGMREIKFYDDLATNILSRYEKIGSQALNSF